MINTEAYVDHDGYEIVIRGLVEYERADSSTGWAAQYFANVEEVEITVDGVTYDLNLCSYVDHENENRVTLADLDEDDLEEALCDAYRDDCDARYVDAHT